MNIEDEIYVAGHRGLVGSAIVRALESTGFKNVVTRRDAAPDLTIQGSRIRTPGWVSRLRPLKASRIPSEMPTRSSSEDIHDEDIYGLMEHIEEEYPGLFAEISEVKSTKDLGIGHNPAQAPPQQPAK